MVEGSCRVPADCEMCAKAMKVEGMVGICRTESKKMPHEERKNVCYVVVYYTNKINSLGDKDVRDERVN